jgi:hypothetical protein
MSKKSKESKSIDLLKQKAKDSNRVDHFNFLNHLINIQGKHKYINSREYKKPYISKLERILRNMDN